MDKVLEFCPQRIQKMKCTMGPSTRNQLAHFQTLMSNQQPGKTKLIASNLLLKLFATDSFSKTLWGFWSRLLSVDTNSLSMWSNYPFFIFLCPKIVSVNYPNSIGKILATSQNFSMFFENIAKSKNVCFLFHKNIFILSYGNCDTNKKPIFVISEDFFHNSHPKLLICIINSADKKVISCSI